MLKRLARLLPHPTRRWLAAHWPWPEVPRMGQVRFGSLRRLTPVSARLGFDRGQPEDRYYIERFMQQEVGAVRSQVLKIGDRAYTCQFGGARVTGSDVLLGE
jgi:hypothetical protein